MDINSFMRTHDSPEFRLALADLIRWWQQADDAWGAYDRNLRDKDLQHHAELTREIVREKMQSFQDRFGLTLDDVINLSSESEAVQAWLSAHPQEPAA